MPLTFSHRAYHHLSLVYEQSIFLHARAFLFFDSKTDEIFPEKNQAGQAPPSCQLQRDRLAGSNSFLPLLIAKKNKQK